MSKAITKEYLIRNLKNFDDQVLEDKYLQGVTVNGTAATVTNGVAAVEAVTEVTVNGETDLVTYENGSVDITLPDAVEYKIAQQATAETGFFATYTIQSKVGADGAWADVVGAAKINIPKDFLVKSVTLETVAVDDEPVEGYVVGDKYIDFVVNTIQGDEQATHLYLLVSDLIDVYTAGNGIDITSGVVSVVAKTAGGLVVDATGVAVNVKANGGLIADATGLYVDFEPTDGTADIDFTNWDQLSV